MATNKVPSLSSTVPEAESKPVEPSKTPVPPVIL